MLTEARNLANLGCRVQLFGDWIDRIEPLIYANKR